MKTKVISLAFGLALLLPLNAAADELKELCILRLEVIKAGLELKLKGVSQSEIIRSSPDTLGVKKTMIEIFEGELYGEEFRKFITKEHEACLLGEYL